MPQGPGHSPLIFLHYGMLRLLIAATGTFVSSLMAISSVSDTPFVWRNFGHTVTRCALPAGRKSLCSYRFSMRTNGSQRISSATVGLTSSTWHPGMGKLPPGRLHPKPKCCTLVELLLSRPLHLCSYSSGIYQVFQSSCLMVSPLHHQRQLRNQPPLLMLH